MRIVVYYTTWYNLASKIAEMYGYPIETPGRFYWYRSEIWISPNWSKTPLIAVVYNATRWCRQAGRQAGRQVGAFFFGSERSFELLTASFNRFWHNELIFALQLVIWTWFFTFWGLRLLVLLLLRTNNNSNRQTTSRPLGCIVSSWILNNRA